MEQDLFEKFGDRTSSFITLYPGFESFVDPQARPPSVVRWVGTRHAWIAANEPLAPAGDRAGLFEAMAANARADGKKFLALPVSLGLARALKARGWDVLPLGSEPIFDLEDYFGHLDPLSFFPKARAWAKRGATVRPLGEGEHESLRPRLDTLTARWLHSRRGPELSFLNQVKPFWGLERRKIFVLQWQERPWAFVSAVPLAGGKSYFFADLIRDPEARHGMQELLVIEAMRALRAEGVLEVRLGLSPLRELHESCRVLGLPRDWRVGFLDRLGRWLSPFYSFAGNRAFKDKLKPTRWEPLFVASDRRMRTWSLAAVARVQLKSTSWSRYFSRRLPFQVSLSSLRCTLGAALFMTGLHLWIHGTAAGARWYAGAGFSARDYRWDRLWISPLAHNHAFHFFGDLASFLLFGGAVEAMHGKRLWLILVAAGLWLSNPLTHALHLLVPGLDGGALYAQFLQERDFGSSNAVYALVGGVAASISRPWVLLLPFALNGIYICWANQSTLALHHLVALFGGYVLARAFGEEAALR